MASKVLEITDNLSTALQGPISAGEGQAMADATVKRLEELRGDDGFDQLFNDVEQSATDLGELLCMITYIHIIILLRAFCMFL